MSAICTLLLGAEIGLRVRLLKTVVWAETFQREHPSVFTARPMVDAWQDSLWETPWVEYRRNSHLSLRVGDRTYVVETNSLGYRTREFSRSKPTKSIRVICIGGSTTVQGATNDATYPALLGSMLQRLHPHATIEVLNLGISGIETDYWPERGVRFLQYEPDIVIQYEGVNDLLHRHVPRWAASHPWHASLYRSLLFSRFVGLPAREMSGDVALSLANIEVVSKACKRAGAVHVIGTFAAPDIAKASEDERAYLGINLLQQWSAPNLPLHNYSSYLRLLEEFNHALVARAAKRYVVAPVAARVRDPSSFVDICHMNAQGIEALAAAFLPEVDRAITARLDDQSSSPVGRRE